MIAPWKSGFLWPLLLLCMAPLAPGRMLVKDLRILKQRCCRTVVEDVVRDCIWLPIMEPECPQGFEARPDLSIECPLLEDACIHIRAGSRKLFEGAGGLIDEARELLQSSWEMHPQGSEFAKSHPIAASALRCNLAVVMLLGAQSEKLMRAAHRLFTTALMLDAGNEAAANNIVLVQGFACADMGPSEPLFEADCLPLPGYHALMLHDKNRNEAYARAIQWALKRRPGARVLDIGAGSGLLSILAAKEGASDVVAFEMVRPIAALAHVHALWNGVADRVNVMAERSDQCTSCWGGGGSKDWRADVIVHEVFDSIMLGEEVARSLSHAVKAFGKPDTIIVPAKSSAYIHWVHSKSIARHRWLDHGTISDSDLTDSFGSSIFSRYSYTAEASTLPETYKLTERTPVLELQFANLSGTIQGSGWFSCRVHTHGHVHAAILSFDFSMPSGETVSTDASGRLLSNHGRQPTHWGQQIFFRGDGQTVWDGDTILFYVQWDASGIELFDVQIKRGNVGKKGEEGLKRPGSKTSSTRLEIDANTPCLDYDLWYDAAADESGGQGMISRVLGIVEGKVWMREASDALTSSLSVLAHDGFFSLETFLAVATSLMLDQDFENARCVLSAALELGASSASRQAQACLLVLTSIISLTTGRGESARPVLHEALELLPGDHPSRISVFNNLAVLAASGGDDKAAFRFLGAAAVSRAEERWKHVATSNLHYLARKARPNMQVLSDAIKTMNHGRRMEVYFKSIRNATLGRPRFSRNVVIIGSAGGALAVMASRAGADRVYVCEKTPWETAWALGNAGLSGAQTVEDGDRQGSGDCGALEVAEVDIVVMGVCETPAVFATGLHSIFWMYSAMEGLRARGKHAVVIPSRIEATVHLAHSPAAWRYRGAPAGILGVNVSLWRSLSVSDTTFVEVDQTWTQVLTYPLTPAKSCDGMSWNLSSERKDPFSCEVTLDVLDTARAHCVVISYAMDFPGGSRFVESAGEKGGADVGRLMYILPSDVFVRRGQSIVVTMGLSTLVQNKIMVEGVRIV